MEVPHQQQEYDSIQASRPCCYRGELELTMNEVPATPCCQAKSLVKDSRFNCTLYNTYIRNASRCWACPGIKSENCQ